MKKKILLVIFALFVTMQVAAQRFEWVRGFAPGENVTTVGAVTDSLGNLYILGSINFNTSWENGSRLLPINPHNYARDIGDVLIAKISPDGDLVWHKVIHGNLTGSEPHDIKPLGDTAFACLVTMPLANQDCYLYYLDTMVHETWDRVSPITETPYPDYPISTHGFDIGTCLALITFDFDGNVLEQHFLNISFLDKYGEDITRVPLPYETPWYHTTDITYPSFAIDGDGNIYLTHTTTTLVSVGPEAPNDYYDVRDGTISAVKFWCDRRVVGVVPADSTLYFSPQLLKFSPHFDTLLNSRYVYQSYTALVGFNTKYPYLRVDKTGDLYMVGTYTPAENTEGIITVDSTRNIQIVISPENRFKEFFVRFDSSLTAKHTISLDDSVLNQNVDFSNRIFMDIAFDDEKDLMFLCGMAGTGHTGDSTNNYLILSCQGVPLDKIINDAFFLAFNLDNDSARLVSYGCVPSKMHQSMISSSAYRERDNIACQNGRVFLQAQCTGGLRLPNNNIVFSSQYTKGLGFCIFDYQGNVLGGDAFYAFGTNHRTGPVAIRDSNLYLINLLTSSATFGDIEVPSRGTYFSCIAKYTDPAFAQPYVAIAPVEAAEGAATVYPNPATDRIRVALPSGEAAAEAYVIDLAGRRRQVPLHGDEVDLGAAPAGLLFLQIFTERHIYNHKIIKL